MANDMHDHPTQRPASNAREEHIPRERRAGSSHSSRDEAGAHTGASPPERRRRASDVLTNRERTDRWPTD
jgi:hypothetical protein